MFRTFLRLITVVLVVPVVISVPAWAQTARPRTPADSQPTAAAPPAGKPAVIVNLNTATLAELEALPGVGAKTAARIIDYRQKKGPFKKIEEILENSRSGPYSLNISHSRARRVVSRSRGNAQ